MKSCSFIVRMCFVALIVASAGAVGLCVYANLCLSSTRDVYFWSIDGNRDGECSLGGFECEEVPNTPDCILRFRVYSMTSCVAGWSIWCLDTEDEIKIMFEIDSLGNVPTCSKWDESSLAWVYEYKIPNGKMRKIIVSDGHHNVVVKRI